jgi:hypothetical protein
MYFAECGLMWNFVAYNHQCVSRSSRRIIIMNSEINDGDNISDTRTRKLKNMYEKRSCSILTKVDSNNNKIIIIIIYYIILLLGIL